MLIQKLRLQRGWSQEQLAELSGLSARTIQRLERGESASVESLKCLAAVFEVDFATLRSPAMSDDQTAVSDRPSAVGADEALALAHVRHIRGFYMHLAQFILVVGLLTILNLVTHPSYFWAGWVMLGWGSGVLLHGLRVFNRIPFLDAAWERRQVERYLGRKLS